MEKEVSGALVARAIGNAVGLIVFALALIGWGVAKDLHWSGTSEACGWLAAIVFFMWCLS